MKNVKNETNEEGGKPNNAQELLRKRKMKRGPPGGGGANCNGQRILRSHTLRRSFPSLDQAAGKD